MTAIAVTIAGSDSGGGAGIQADLKSFAANGVYGASVLTALTAQNTLGVSAIHELPSAFVQAQMRAVYEDLSVGATKIGMLSRPNIIETVASELHRLQRLDGDRCGPIVLDPVMVAASGDPLLADNAVDSLVHHLFPLATLITPNLPEAARILGTDPAEGRAAMEEQARALHRLGARAVLLKGGHGAGATSADLFLDGEASFWLEAPRHVTRNTHGTGCTLSSAIAAGLAKGMPLAQAVEAAKVYITGAIAAADTLSIGQGHGPVHHFFKFQEA
ncbi:bifunctional hydroxymethylpyrimidine kinase/phosphomethylpyrimidine kinase [Roseibium aestuarii]|uniref:hydroxymethylpyrimidine kinase n=1 Tax=Roseibium aestuarii TaxID=2600299 RepID=A0ABW4JWT2_9HYPH|nr:bifunctional hydroxymethylpyrimidine kinase/phosphomethylpyrimidine kinase [Roseibium aestuarii]